VFKSVRAALEGRSARARARIRATDVSARRKNADSRRPTSSKKPSWFLRFDREEWRRITATDQRLYIRGPPGLAVLIARLSPFDRLHCCATSGTVPALSHERHPKAKHEWTRYRWWGRIDVYPAYRSRLAASKRDALFVLSVRFAIDNGRSISRREKKSSGERERSLRLLDLLEQSVRSWRETMESKKKGYAPHRVDDTIASLRMMQWRHIVLEN